jgi:hypothetical protein
VTPVAGDDEAGVWHVDFEFEVQADGSSGRPFLMAAHHHTTGRTIVLWGDELRGRPGPPFPVDGRTIVVCHFCPAEAGCFASLGWSRPQFFDTCVEFRLSPAYADWREQEAIRRRHRHLFRDEPKRPYILKLNEMARTLGVAPLYEDAEKEALQSLAASGGPFSRDQERQLIAYCIADTLMTRRCLPHLIANERDWAAAALRAEFLLLNQEMKARGVPVDAELEDLVDHRAFLRERVIREWDRFGLFRAGSFSNRAFVDFLAERGLPWPCHASGPPDLRQETFREQARIHPVFAEIGRLRDTVSMLRRIGPRVDPDGRTRTDLRPFVSKTGRSQPSSSTCLFLMPKFMRPFIESPPGLAIIQADYGQQEVLIAAVHSRDEALLRTYREGDCYLGLGKQLGLIPPEGTTETHPAERNRCKPLLLGVLYRMSAQGLKARLKISGPKARDLHRRLHRTFAAYFAWSESVVATTRTGRPLVTPMGWKLHARPHADSSRSRTNFLVQATGSDILRTACLLAVDRGLPLIMTVHDSLLIQIPDVDVEWAKAVLRTVMLEAAILVLGPLGAAMRIDIEVARAGERLPVEPADEAKYRDVRRWLEEAKDAASAPV